MKPPAIGPYFKALRLIEVEEPDMLIENCQVSGYRTEAKVCFKHHCEKERSQETWLTQ